MAWLTLLLAGALEIVWAAAMKASDGLTRLHATTTVVIAMAASVWLLSLALKTLPLGTAYAVWTGIGASGSFLVGVLLFGEPCMLGRTLGAGLVILGIVLMRVYST
jgi:quaternary ammonium compound-resistance protein SugE